MTDGRVILPRRSLIVLCGPAGADKSTFASEVARTNGLATTAIVSSDACRLMLCDETDSVRRAQWPIPQPKTFDLFLTIIAGRTSIGRPTIADGVNLRMELRPRRLSLARTHEYPSALVVFDISFEVCRSQNAGRGRQMPEEQLRVRRQALDQALPRLADEGWDRVVVLNDRRRTVSLVLDGS